MTPPDQVYKTHIDATPAQVWDAITNPEFCKQYWFGNANVAAKWEKGGAWEHKGMENGAVYHSGIIEESVKNERLVLSWGNPGDDKDISRVSFTLEAKDGGVELTIIHGDFVEGSVMAESGGEYEGVVGNRAGGRGA
jgi:uncharacterized protein YndB with AHSA1/START domain